MRKFCHNSLCTESFILFIDLKKKKKGKFSFFPIVKMAAKYKEIGRLGKLEADFQKVPLVRMF